MAGAHRGKAPDLIRSLLKEGASYSFVQVMRLLRLALQEGPEGDPHALLRDRVRVRPQLSLAFAQTDLAGVERLEEDPETFRVTAQFLGLYGASSPLPTFYTEELLDEQADGYSVSRDFLDIINAPIYPLHFRSWSKHRLFYNIVENPNAEFLERLYCLLGLGGERFRARVRNPYAMLRYIGIMEQFPRSAEGLRTLLADTFQEPSFRILQCLEREVPIPEGQTLRLGLQGHALGEETTLGTHVKDRQGKFRVEVGPLDLEGFRRLLPGEGAFRELSELVELYLDRPLAWDLEIGLAPGTLQGLCLGDPFWGRLGVNAWVFSPPWTGGLEKVVFEGEAVGGKKTGPASIQAE